MTKNARELRDERAQLIEQATTLNEAVEAEGRDFTQEEQLRYDQLLQNAAGLLKRAERDEDLKGLQGSLVTRQAPAQLKIGRGDSEIRAWAHFFRKGDLGAVSGLTEEDEDGKGPVVQVPTGLALRAVEMRAVDSTMNITTAADGAASVPTGFSGAIALRRNEIRLAERLGIRMVPGKGTTVKYPFENADPSVFAATSEQADDGSTNNYQRDVAPVMANKDFTLAKKTKKLWLTEELLDDEDINLMAAIADTIGRALGMTHNSLLITEVAANGSVLKTFASATAIAAGEIEDIVYGDTVGFYFDDGGSIHWVTRPATYGNVKSITGNPRMYGADPQDGPAAGAPRALEGFPVHWSLYPAATAASAKDIYFGNWNFVGMREEPALRFIRDPFSVDGIVVLKYSFRTVYGVLIAGAVGYGVHPSA